MTHTPKLRASSRLRRLGQLVVLLHALQAHAEDSVSDWSTPHDEQCVPTCRDGFECNRGQCSPICNPMCGPGYLCTSGGECVRTDARAGRTPVYRSTQVDGCFPTCRNGFACLDGACVSICNPACPRGEMCTARGECVPEGDGPMSMPDEPEPERPSSADSIVALYADPLGALQYGLVPTLEVGARLSGYLAVRPMNTGMASYLTLGRDPEDKFRWGIGGTLGMHIFSARDGNLRGFYGGPALEYALVNTRDKRRDYADYHTQYLLPEADFGHRWAFGRFLVGISLRLGLAIPVRDQSSPIGPMGCATHDSCRPDHRVTFLPGLALDLGYFFPRRRN